LGGHPGDSFTSADAEQHRLFEAHRVEIWVEAEPRSRRDHRRGAWEMSTAPASPAPPQFITPNFDNMPPELKQRPKWVLWVPILKGSKWTKRPIQPSGFGASTTNPRHGSCFEDARRQYERAVEQGGILLRERNGKRFVPIGGVGFVFDNQQDENGLVLAGIDFDRVVSTEGKIASFAAERIKRFRSYSELSVSGSGLHIIVKAHPLSAGISHNGIEIYTSERYFTMTGCTGSKSVAIMSAEQEVAALIDELLRAQSGTTASTDYSPSNAFSQPQIADPRKWEALQGANDLAAGIETGAWVDRLPTEVRTEVIRHAVSHIARGSKIFELSHHGGNYQEYFKIALAIARSGVADREDIFVEAALTAKDADPEPKLRDFFRSCECAPQRSDGVTVGTLLHYANQCGADFGKWKQLADAQVATQSGAPDKDNRTVVAHFVPGNEEQCRKLLDQVVAEDRRTFTLGDPAGPLVILRVPDQDSLPRGARWDGDLPGTTLATPADIMQRAERLEWMQPGKGGALVRKRPPRDFIADYLIQMRGQDGAPFLRGVVRVPRIDEQGEIYFVSGYDPHTGLFHDNSPHFEVPVKPSRRDARRSAIALLRPFSKYKFEKRRAGRALVLAAVFTAIERPFLTVAPMFVVRSSMPGTGKGLLVRCLVRLAFNTVPCAATAGGNSEEFEKRIGALLLQAAGALSIDNANAMQIKGDLLESILTEGGANIRPLGRSETIKVRNRSFITLTGNNPIVTGDMARRALVLDIVPSSAEPERDSYAFNPVDLIERDRTRYLRDAFIAMRAFRLAGMPSQGLPAIGSFDEWSRRVRDLVYWLTKYDVSEAFRKNKLEDPRRQGDACLLAALYQQFGTAPFRAADPIDVHKRVADARYGSVTPTPSERELHEALEDVLGNRKVDAKLFGYWARRIKGAHVGGLILETKHDPATNANLITIQKT
jgi:hypothetical protein